MKRWWLVGWLGVSLLVAGGLAHLASSEPDGLERVAEDLDFAEQAEEGGPGCLPDYQVPGHEDSWVGGSLAGVAGTLVVLGAALGLGGLLRRLRREG